MARFNARPNPRTRPAKQLKSNTRKSAQTAPRSSGGISKHDRVLGLLRSKGGTTIATISKATGWQPHSVRGFFAGVVKKKLGLMLESEKTKSGRIYRIVRAKTSGSLPFGLGHRGASRCMRPQGAGGYRLKPPSKMRSLGCAISI
jgi:hypothetical protein